MSGRGVADRGRIGIFTTDADLTIRSWDPSLAEMTAIPADCAVGRRLDDVVPSLGERRMLDLVREPLLSGAPVVLAPALHQYLIPCKPLEPSTEFEHMQQRVVIGALRNDDAAAGIVVTVEDVTARLERERRLGRHLQNGVAPDRLAEVARLSPSDSSETLKLVEAIAGDDWQVRRAAVRTLGRARDEKLVATVVTALREGHRNFSLLSSALELLTLTGVDLTDALVGLLRDPDEDLRIQAALALGTQHTSEAAAALHAALDDPNENVQFHAIEALGKIASVGAIDRLAAFLSSGDFFLAFPAIEALVRIGDPIVAPSLIPFLSDPMLGAAAAEALGQLGDEGVVPPLVEALARANAPAEAIVSAIAAIHRRYVCGFGEAQEIEACVGRALSPPGIRQLFEVLARASGGTLRDAVVVVGWLRDPGVPPALARLLGSADVRHEVVEALVRLGAPAVDLLITNLEADASESRAAASVALGRIGDARAVPGLIALLEDDTRDVQLAAIGALGAIGDRRAFPPLVALLGDAHAGVRQAATAALNSIGHPDMEREIAALVESPDARVREAAVNIAGYFGYASCADAVFARCHDDNEAVRCAALEHLPYFDDARAVDALAAALKQETGRARAAAARALGSVHEPRTRDLLAEALGDDDAWVRYFAAIALGRRQDPSAAPGLLRAATSDPTPHVRVAAIEALGATGGANVLAGLAPFVGDADEDVAHAALRVLSRVSWDGATQMLAEALRSADSRRRLVAVEALTSMADPAAVEMLRWTCAADQDSAVSGAAFATLAAIGSANGPAARTAVDALVSLVGDAQHRERAIQSLARLAPAAIPWVACGLDAPDVRIRAGVADALARMRHPSATACLLRALDDGAETVRRQAITGLDRIGTRGVAQRLAALAERDPSPLVRQAALAALARPGRGGV